MASKPNRTTSDVVVASVDVGQGDCTVIRIPPAVSTEPPTCIMIDCGTLFLADAAKRSNYVGNVMEALPNDKIIHYLIITHADKDHCSLIPKLIKRDCKFQKVFVGGDPEHFRSLFEESPPDIERAVVGPPICEVKSKDFEATFEVVFQDPTAVTANDQSVCSCFTITAKESGDYQQFFFGGDLVGPDAKSKNKPSGETRLLADANAKKKLKRTTIFKLNHHGSRFSNSPDFLSVMQNLKAVFTSCEETNGYHHPHYEIASRLKFSPELKKVKLKLPGSVRNVDELPFDAFFRWKLHPEGEAACKKVRALPTLSTAMGTIWFSMRVESGNIFVDALQQWRVVDWETVPIEAYDPKTVPDSKEMPDDSADANVVVVDRDDNSMEVDSGEQTNAKGIYKQGFCLLGNQYGFSTNF